MQQRYSALLGIVLVVLLVAACGGGGAEGDFVVTPEEGGGVAEDFFGTPGADDPDTDTSPSDANGNDPSGSDEAYPTPGDGATAGTDGEGGDTGDEAYPYPAPTPLPPFYPYPEPPDLPELEGSREGRSLTALEASEIAADYARSEYDPDAQFFMVIPSSVMLRNLGSPPVAPGWFFKFKTDEESLGEFIVQVTDETISGSTNVAALVALDPLELPVDRDEVTVDSNDVFAQFDEVAAEREIPTSREKLYDLELVYLANADEPVWSVVDPETLEWLYTISAITGEEVDYTR